jgi:hypothetical protein
MITSWLTRLGFRSQPRYVTVRAGDDPLDYYQRVRSLWTPKALAYRAGLRGERQYHSQDEMLAADVAELVEGEYVHLLGNGYYRYLLAPDCRVETEMSGRRGWLPADHSAEADPNSRGPLGRGWSPVGDVEFMNHHRSRDLAPTLNCSFQEHIDALTFPKVQLSGHRHLVMMTTYPKHSGHRDSSTWVQHLHFEGAQADIADVSWHINMRRNRWQLSLYHHDGTADGSYYTILSCVAINALEGLHPEVSPSWATTFLEAHHEAVKIVTINQMARAEVDKIRAALKKQQDEIRSLRIASARTK